MASLMPNGKQRYTDNNGNNLAGGKLYTYEAGTSTPLATYSDQAGTTPNTNPVILNARGEATIFWGSAPYKVKLTDASDVEIWTQDNLHAQVSVVDLSSTTAGMGAALVGYSTEGITVTAALDNRIPQIATYAALRAYSGAVTAYYVRGVAADLDGGAGVFRVDASDTTSADNGGTILVDASGRRWKREFSGAINVKWFGAKGDGVTDDTTAITTALAAGGTTFIPEGTFLCAVTSVPSGANIEGVGVSSVLQPLTNTSRAAIAINSADAVSFIDDLTFRNVKFLGTVAADGFFEQAHLLTLNGVRNALVERCWFVGFRGDGLYIGSGDVGGQERHNHNVTVRKCHFDGVNNDNRQGISVIDCDGLAIYDNVFENCTRSTMPGAIDIEPDVAAFHIIKNLRIARNKFKNVGGNLGVISLFFASSTIPAPDNVLIEGNEFVSSVTGTAHAEIFLGTTRALADSDADMGIVVRDNRGRGGYRALDIRAVKGVDVVNNRFESYVGANYCGQSIANQAPRNINYVGNRFIKCGTSGLIGLEVFSVDYLRLEGNLFDDCGSGGAGSYAIDFNTGTSSYVSLVRNTFRTPTAKTLQGIVKEAGHTFTPATNTQIGDRFLNSLSNGFQAEESDIYESSYTPVVEGATTPGTGVYTTQLGKYQRLGKRVRFWVHVDVQAGHTGNGLIELSIPLPAKSQTPLIPISVLGAEGITNTERTAMGMLNTAAAAGGVQGAIRMYANAAAGAAQTQLTIPAGAFKLWIQGEYIAA